MKLLLVADGRFFPKMGCTMASTSIELDGETVGNASLIDWYRVTNVQQHTFDNIGVADVSPGAHEISLLVRCVSGQQVVIGADSSLSILESSAKTLLDSQLHADSPLIDVAYGFTKPTRVQDLIAPKTEPVLSLPQPISGNAVVLLSARVYYAYMGAVLAGDSLDRLVHMGDALMGIALDGSILGPEISTWSNNDLWWASEFHAPMFAHALHLGPGSVSVEAVAGKFPWALPDGSGGVIENPVHYYVGAGTELIGVEQPEILGGGYMGSSRGPSAQDYVCVGSSGADADGKLDTSMPPFPGCPAAGARRVIAEADVDLPNGHDGVLLILAKTRIQADASDVGGSAMLGLSVDGLDKGSVGVQGIGAGAGANSQRTMAASYLASGAETLLPGTHRIQVWVRAMGVFVHLAATEDMPLLYFD